LAYTPDKIVAPLVANSNHQHR